MIQLLYSNFTRKSLKLLSVDVISLLLTFVTLSLLAFLNTVETLGRFSVFLHIAGVLVMLANGKYELDILLGETGRKTIAAFQLCFFVNTLICILLQQVLFSFNGDFNFLLVCISLSAFSLSCSSLFNHIRKLVFCMIMK